MVIRVWWGGCGVSERQMDTSQDSAQFVASFRGQGEAGAVSAVKPGKDAEFVSVDHDGVGVVDAWNR